jgi:hypothetical protein
MHYFDLVKKLYGNNVVSNCCRYKILLKYCNKDNSYYICKKCSKPCETHHIEDMSGEVK